MHENEIVSTINAVADNINGLATDMKSRQKKVEDSLADVEQTMARFMSSGSQAAFVHAAASVGASAIEQLKAEGNFEAAASAAARGMKPSRFDARVDLDNSIRAALTTTGSGNAGDTAFPTPNERRGTIVAPQRPLRLLDVLPSRPTGSDAVEFIQLTATGDAAEQIHEGDEKAEIEFEGALQTANIVTIAGHTTASKQVLADNNALGQQINGVINNKVLARLENQLINGPGGQGRINGLVNQATAFIPTIGTTPADIIGESLVTMANDGYQPKLVLMNPLDWFRIQVTRKNEDDDEYVFGSPTVPVPPALWNTAIVTTPSIAAGTAMTVDTSYTTVLDREQVSIAVSNSHKDYFTRNLVAILGELRAGLEVLDTRAIKKFSLTAPAGG
jgi:HK97 family phage major capsid protein